MAITTMTNPTINALSDLEIRVVGSSLAVDFTTPVDSDYEFVRVYLGDSDLDITDTGTIDYVYDTRESGTLKNTPFSSGITKTVIMQVFDTLGAGTAITTFTLGAEPSATAVTFAAVGVGPAGADSILIRISSSAGTIFKGSLTSSTATVNVEIGGELQDAAAHNGYEYKWTQGGQTVCVDASRNLLDNGVGSPLLSSDGLTCMTGVPADSTLSTDTLGSTLRSIVVGTEDAALVTSLSCLISNLPN